jgi:hypothetical protein
LLITIISSGNFNRFAIYDAQEAKSVLDTIKALKAKSPAIKLRDADNVKLKEMVADDPRANF